MAATDAQSTSSWRILRFPIIVLVIFGAIVASPWICRAMNLEFDDDVVPFFMMTQWFGPLLAFVILVFWWTFFSGINWSTRFLGLFLVALVIGAFIFSLRKVELTTGTIALVPRFYFVWEQTPEQELQHYLKTNAAKEGELAAVDMTVGPEDYPWYRGVHFDGVISNAKLQTDWQNHKPVKLWESPCPGGYSGVAVAGNIAVTLQQRDKQEAVVCYDRTSGKMRWEYVYDAYHKDVMGDGPRSTPAIHRNRIFTTGAVGDLVCLDGEGKKIWSKNILELANAVNIKWGMTGSPLIVGDMVIANPGVNPESPQGPSLIAFDQATGAVVWKVGKRKAGYSSPQLATFGGVQQILLFDGEGLVGYDPKDGTELWSFPWVTDFEMNSIQPVVLSDDRVLISSEIKNGCAMLRIKSPNNDKKAWQADVVWQNKNLAARYANPIADGKQIFALHNMQGVLRCLDADSGKILWSGDTFKPGQLLLTDNALLVVNGDTGEVTMFDPKAKNQILGQFQPFESPYKTWNTPTLAGDQLFVRNQMRITCWKLPRK